MIIHLSGRGSEIEDQTDPAIKSNQENKMDGHVIVRAVKHPANYKPIIFCSISLVAVGSIMVILGIVIMLIDHVEMGPPHFDPLYERYEGSSLASVMGKCEERLMPSV